MKKRSSGGHTSNRYTDGILNSVGAVLTISILAIVFGIFFIVMQADNKPIPREEALTYSGEFEKYDCYTENDRTIHFKDGSTYDVYPHTEKAEFRDAMMSLEKGTVLSLSVNPNNGYVIEVKTPTEELLNFERSQAAIDSYDNGYIAIGIFMCVCGAVLPTYPLLQRHAKKKEKARHTEKRKKRGKNANDAPISRVDRLTKSKTLLTAEVKEYKICYRRVRSTNELVINGFVYDEMTAIIEFEHKLCARVDGHTIAAGLDGNEYSYITFDGNRIAEKKRLL